ncbi:MAG: hypothetical protein A3D56_01760 [Candidatus Taylorbacteria bacterium RIFCSPHIGHO2_02_FULL_45_35]|uniref:Uncharacterized protein n=1 Tax=Candidatus Taylorbacteria bacterium RIFCSPHIGHO2_02_FULL_45_35 TaxID=1802311 RepID=A0A1G2MPT4_9BACT|nr:MAG: hypothetical protein A3D56_01760 [Candidatus Taylorbacteria bacterium RIFCSPHIGHO2_02_FULL_45_35]OHA32363.1 MAG: hypothetical protein A3A22_03590 [Candidatus Taylorbacteria bacterium RIFCSPLOWO2_01_FULL_45_34b]
MSISPKCDFCKRELIQVGGLLFSPPTKEGKVRKYHLCRSCFRRIIRITEWTVTEMEDILSLGPKWFNYTKKVKKKKH